MIKFIEFQKSFSFLIIFYFLLFNIEINADNPLTPLKLESPRDTVRIFLNSMNEYKKEFKRMTKKKFFL